MFERLKNYKNPVLLWSGGLDSTLLLSMLIEANIPVDIVQFGREFWTKEQKKRADDLIMKFGLKILSYPPTATSVIGKDGQLAFVEQYTINDAVIPMVRDILPDTGTRCMADLESYKSPASPYLWDCVLIGSRQDDRHYSFDNQVIPSEIWKVNNTTFYAPLFAWTRQMILDALRKHGLDATEVAETTDTGNLVGFCTNCLQGEDDVFCPAEQKIIPSVKWNPEASLASFVGFMLPNGGC